MHCAHSENAKCLDIQLLVPFVMYHGQILQALGKTKTAIHSYLVYTVAEAAQFVYHVCIVLNINADQSLAQSGVSSICLHSMVMTSCLQIYFE